MVAAPEMLVLNFYDMFHMVLVKSMEITLNITKSRSVLPYLEQLVAPTVVGYASSLLVIDGNHDQMVEQSMD